MRGLETLGQFRVTKLWEGNLSKSLVKSRDIYTEKIPKGSYFRLRNQSFFVQLPWRTVDITQNVAPVDIAKAYTIIVFLTISLLSPQ